MSVNPLSSLLPNTATTDASGSATTTLPGKNLTQQDFLKLLVAQMTAQDPMNPQSNADFAAQMAQFSALQTSQETQSQISQLRSSASIQEANSLLGRVVTLQTSETTTATGLVTGVQLSQGYPQLIVNNMAYDPSQVISIQPAPVTPTAQH